MANFVVIFMLAVPTQITVTCARSVDPVTDHKPLVHLLPYFDQLRQKVFTFSFFQVQTPDQPLMPRESHNYPIIISDQSDDGGDEIESEQSFEKSDSEMSRGGRERLKSHDSINSNPKSWADFEEENRSWRVRDYFTQSSFCAMINVFCT